jgi:GNAT superfamily N-acetyltransferase
VTYRIEPLAGHERPGFVSGSAALDRYFRERVTQDVRRRVASCFIVLDSSDTVVGYYTLASAAVPLTDLPPEQTRKLPHYPDVPAVLLGRLAIAKIEQGRGLGAMLVADALLRASRSEIAVYAMLVEAKDENAARFYAHLGFERLSAGRRLIRRL